jgi:flagellar basal body-associated protein FliL
MQKFLKILGIVNRITITFVLIVTVLLTLLVAYIIFAPDNLPKPFYLQYLYPTPAVVGALLPAPTPVPTIEVKPGQGIMIDTGSKIINLAEQDGHKYIRTTVVIEFAPTDPAYAEMKDEEKTTYLTAFKTEIADKTPLINDVIITTFSTKSFEMLYTAQGKEAIRQELLKLISSRMPEYRIISIYFTEFVIE